MELIENGPVIENSHLISAYSINLSIDPHSLCALHFSSLHSSALHSSRLIRLVSLYVFCMVHFYFKLIHFDVMYQTVKFSLFMYAKEVKQKM